MKSSDKSINTIPQGVWEASHSTDMQGNGYPSYQSTNISSDSINKITSLEKELSKENNEDIVLIAYSSNKPTT